MCGGGGGGDWKTLIRKPGLLATPPASVLRSAAAAAHATTSLRRLNFGQINSHWCIWLFKLPQHTPPKKVTKAHYGNRAATTGITIKETARCKVRAAGPQFTVDI